jgi:hypothetical protein
MQSGVQNHYSLVFLTLLSHVVTLRIPLFHIK